MLGASAFARTPKSRRRLAPPSFPGSLWPVAASCAPGGVSKAAQRPQRGGPAADGGTLRAARRPAPKAPLVLYTDKSDPTLPAGP